MTSYEFILAAQPLKSTGATIAISLVIPAYNEEKYITPTLESVGRAKTKYERATGKSVEVVVVDNASADRTAEIARSFGCTVIPFDKHQMSAVRNAGAATARGEYIAFVDADRSIVHEDLFLEIDANLSNPRIFGGGTRFRPEKSSLNILIAVTLVRLFCWVLRTGCMLYYLRRSDFDDMGGWNEQMYAAEDVDMSLRMKKAAKASGRKLRNLRGRLTFCVRKFHMLPAWRTLRDFLRLVRRWDFSKPDEVARFYYDVDNLR